MARRVIAGGDDEIGIAVVFIIGEYAPLSCAMSLNDKGHDERAS